MTLSLIEKFLILVNNSKILLYLTVIKTNFLLFNFKCADDVLPSSHLRDQK